MKKSGTLWSIRDFEHFGGRALYGQGWPKAIPISRKLRIPIAMHCRQTFGAKIISLKGKSPDRKLRSLSNLLVVKKVMTRRQPGGGLGSSHPLKKA